MERGIKPAANQNWLWVILLVILANLVQLPLLQLSRGSVGHRVLWGAIYLGGFAVAVAIAAWRYRSLWREAFHWQRLTRRDWRLMVGGYLLMLVTEQVLSLLNYYVSHQTSTANNQAISRLLGQSPWTMVLMSLTAICASPFLEEFTFRGLLMDGCFGPQAFWVPIVVSGIAFSLVHASTTLISALIYAVMGGVFAYVYRKTGKIQATIILHAFNNLIAMGMMWVTLLS